MPAVLKFLEGMESAQRIAYIRRAMWPELEGRVRKTIGPIKLELERHGFELESDGTRRQLLFKKQIESLADSGACNELPSHLERQNFVSYRFRRRETGLRSVETGDHVFESGAALTFTQSPTGGIYAVFEPSTSELQKLEDYFLVVGHFSSPISVQRRQIELLSRMFLRCALVTHALHEPTLSDSIFMWRLRVKHANFDAETRSQVFVLLKQAFASSRAVAGLI